MILFCSIVSSSLFVAFRVVAQTARIVEMLYVFAYAYDAAHRFYRNHQRRVGEPYATRIGGGEEREKPLLLAYVPSAVARTEAVCVLPSRLVDEGLQSLFHLVSSFLGNDAAYRVRYENLNHVALALQPLLKIFEFVACRGGEYRKSLAAIKLSGNNLTNAELVSVYAERVVFSVNLALHDEETEPRNANPFNLAHHNVYFRQNFIVGNGRAVAHAF